MQCTVLYIVAEQAHVSWMQGVDGVPRIEEGLNPATWMLEVTTPGMEDKLGINFAEYYANSDLAK